MVRITVAFASSAHAEQAVAFLGRSTVAHRLTSPIAATAPGFVAEVHLVVDELDVSRIRTLVHGTHGIVLAQEPLEAVSAA